MLNHRFDPHKRRCEPVEPGRRAPFVEQIGAPADPRAEALAAQLTRNHPEFPAATIANIGPHRNVL
jgi:hypothetical protein